MTDSPPRLPVPGAVARMFRHRLGLTDEFFRTVTIGGEDPPACLIMARASRYLIVAVGGGGEPAVVR
jgi:hypothetical protein